jgi:primosomal protein N' (replication factor Y)
MNVLEVIPIAKGIPVETLTYFTGSEVSLGSVVKVPLRKKIISAIVVSIREVGDLKSEIKNSNFALKKIEKIKSYEFFRKEFIQAAADTAEYYVGSTGAVLNSIVPKYIFENIEKINILPETEAKKSSVVAEKFVIQSNDEDRYAHYKSIIREEFAKGSSVFFCLPTIQDIEEAKSLLQKGIESYTYALHSSVSKTEVVQEINKILAEKHTVLIIATGGYLSIPRIDIGTIIVDKAATRSYKTQIRPYLDMRNFATYLAKRMNAKIIFGDLLLRAEVIHRFKKGEFVEITPLKFRSLATCTETLIDMRPKKDTVNPTQINIPKEKQVFKIFSPELEKKIQETIENNERMFLFTARRGLSPSTVCADCGNIVKCNTCGAHTVLHKSNTENFFLCHKCGERRSAFERCAHCLGARLTTLGIGSELVEEELKKAHPHKKIFRLDADIATTHKKALEIIESFYNSAGSILVGTEMALLYLQDMVENSAVVSVDSFFSIPDFRINERVLNILLKLRSITEKSLIIQTRDIEQKVFTYALSGNLIDFFRDEIEDREMLKYPPFSILIKISVSGSKDEIVNLTEKLHAAIAPYEIDIFPAFVPHTKGKYGINGIIKVPTHDWPHKQLLAILRSLPINFSINVDPDSLL